MALIVYADRYIDFKGINTSAAELTAKFAPAVRINKAMEAKGFRIAYMFIDSLLDSFEAANRFYFDVLGCTEIAMLNIYRSGCGPVQAVSDAKMLIDNGLVDAAFIFGHEPLASIKNQRGKQDINKAMSIFDEATIPAAYNQLAYRLLNVLKLKKEHFFEIADLLFENYHKAYKEPSNTANLTDRGTRLDQMDADLFALTDCANPYVDFTGGLIIANPDVTDYLEVPENKRIEVIGAKYNVVGDGPANIEKIVGTKETPFPHLGKAFENACGQGGVDFVKEFKSGNALMEVYTCYPPIPIGFLLAAKMVDSIDQVPDFLRNYNITLTGGLNLARAPWNNPALNALVALCQEFPHSNQEYGLVHGNGGLGGLQGVAVLRKK